MGVLSMWLSIKIASRSVFKQSHNFFKFAVLAFWLFAVSYPVSHARAQLYEMEKVPQVPPFSERTLDDFMKIAELKKIEPPFDPYASAVLLLPKGWRISNDYREVYDLGEQDSEFLQSEDTIREETRIRRMMGHIASYFSPPSHETPSRLVVEAHKLDHLMRLEDWYLYYLFQRGYTLMGYTKHAPDKVEVIYTSVIRGESFIVRSMVFAENNRAIVFSYHLPEARWTSECQVEGFDNIGNPHREPLNECVIQARVLESIVMNEREPKKIEPMRSFVYLDLISFQYPASMRIIDVETEELLTGRSFIVNEGINKVLGGQIEIFFFSTRLKTPLEKRIEGQLEQLEEKGLYLGDPIEADMRVDLPDFLSMSDVKAYELIRRGTEMATNEYWYVVLSEDRYHYFIGMTTPSRDMDFYNWARNVAAFNRAMETISIPEF